MKNLESESLFVKCQCSTHCLEIQHFNDETDSGFYMTFWNAYRNGKILSWKNRFRWIWRIFVTGNPWSDGIVIDKDQALNISEYIIKHL